MVKFKTTKKSHELISQIVDRASQKFAIEDRMNLFMDITATHCNGTPLDLEKFLGFDDFNFAHDIYGIMNHIDRNTGKISRFLPRCSK